MPWGKKYNESEVLDSAMLAFWRRGYEGTSMQDLVDATGINRGSIYAAFTSKRELFLRTLEHYDRIYRERHLRRVSEAYPPRDAIVEAFVDAARKPDNEERPWGCLLVNSALELSPHDPEVRTLVQHSLRAVERFFLTHIEAGQASGEINPEIDARATAQALLGLFLGLRVMTRSGGNRRAIDSIVSQARTMLE